MEWIIFPLFALIATIFVLLYKGTAKKQLFGNREPLPLDELYDTLMKSHGVTYETFIIVYEALGNCYSIPSGKVRPTDKINYFLTLDSWDLNAGTEKFETWLRDTVSIEERQMPEILTVLDLLLFVERKKLPSER